MYVKKIMKDMLQKNILNNGGDYERIRKNNSIKILKRKNNMISICTYS